MRSPKIGLKEEETVLEAPVRTRVLKGSGSQRSVGKLPPRRDLGEDFGRRAYGRGADGAASESKRYVAANRYPGLRVRLHGGIPRSTVGRLVGGFALLAGLVAFTAGLWEAWSFLLHDPRLVIESSSSIQIVGNSHMTRPQLLSIFGDDVDRNILTVSLAARRAELESLPWVAHASVMRLLPNKMRISITERTPVAFVREGGHIGLVDADGVLLDISPDAPVHSDYSFPVVTGISAGEPLSTRAARMKLFLRFTSELEAAGAAKNLSEVDLSNPEDVKALIPDASSEILVHFGEDGFLGRYQRYEQNLPGWKMQYPKLASVDMRYEHQVVLEMRAGTVVPLVDGDAGADGKTTVKGKSVGERKHELKALAPGRLTKGVVAPKKLVTHHLQTAHLVHANGHDRGTKLHAAAGRPQ